MKTTKADGTRYDEPFWNVDLNPKQPPIIQKTTWHEETESYDKPVPAEDGDLQKGDYLLMTVKAKGGVWISSVGFGAVFQASHIIIVKGFGGDGELDMTDMPIHEPPAALSLPSEAFAEQNGVSKTKEAAHARKRRRRRRSGKHGDPPRGLRARASFASVFVDAKL